MKKEFSESEYPLKDLTEKIIAAAFKVHNTLGSGFVEKVYENALAEELRRQGHTVEQQRSFTINYNGKSVGKCNPDLDVDESVIVEVKAVKNFEKSFEAKLLHYLKATKYQVGLIINFADKVYIKRKVNTSASSAPSSASSASSSESSSAPSAKSSAPSAPSSSLSL